MSASASAATEEFEGAIGIDLGTTYSCVGVWRNGKVEIVPNEGGNRTTPSFVAFTKSEKLWGDAAKNQLAMNAANTVYDAKRLIGRSFSDADVQKDAKIWPFQIKAGEHDKPLISVDYKGEKQSYHAEQISSILLAGLKGTAEKFLGKRVTKAVITVPAYFNDAQRTTTKMAGQLAGLNVLRIINEPTAAALAYGLEGGTTAEDAPGRTVLVFDLGGGTFDVSLIRLEGPVFEVKATAGNTHLGGQDFDNSMVEFCLKEIQRMAGVDASSNQKVVRKLRTACEKAKRILSAATEDVIEVDVEGRELSIKITRAKFEQINRALFDACMKDVKRVLEDAKCEPSGVDDVVMVGGSSRIPKIQNMVSEFFGKPLKHSINPDEAVAHGAAIQGHVLAGNKAKEGDVGDVLLLDVVPLSIGVDVDGGVLDILIKRNTTIPRKVEKTYTTADDELTEVTVDVYEGERKQARLNNHLGSFELTDITPGIPSIKVTFEVDANGVLNVSAIEVGGKAKGKITITNTNRLSKSDIDRMLADAVRFQKEDVEFAKVQHMRAVLEPFSYSMLDCVENEDNKVEAWIVEEVKGHVTWVEEHLMDATLEELKNHYTDLKNLHAQLEEMWMDAEEDEEKKKRKATGKRKRKNDDSDSDEDWDKGGKAAAESSSSEDEASGADSDEEGGKKKKKEKKSKKEKKQKTEKTEKPAGAKSAGSKPPAKKIKKETPAAQGASATTTTSAEKKKDAGDEDGAAPMEVDGEDKPPSAAVPAKAPKVSKPPKAVDGAASSTHAAATTDAASPAAADAKPKKEKQPPKPKAEKADKPEKEKAEKKADKPEKEKAEKKPKEPKEQKPPKEPKEKAEKKEKAPPKEKKEKPEKEANGAAATSGGGAAASPAKKLGGAPIAPLGAPRRRVGLGGVKKTEEKKE